MLNIQVDQGRTMLEVRGDILQIVAELGSVIHNIYNQIHSEEGRETFRAFIKYTVNDYEEIWELDEAPKGVKIDGKAMEAILRKMRGEERG